MKTKLKKAQEFQEYLNVIFHGLWDANTHFNIFKGLGESSTKYKNIFEMAPWFWSYTSRAHIEIAVLHLCRVYDKDPSAVHVRFLLDVVRDPANTPIFCRNAFLERLKHNTSRANLADAFGTPDIKQIEKDVEFCSDKNPLIKNLHKVRGDVIAHRNKGLAEGEAIFYSKRNVPYVDIEKLIDNGFAILNRCGGWFNATSYSQLPPSQGEKDYLQVLNSLQEAVRERASYQLALNKALSVGLNRNTSARQNIR